jgi:hypothetical protein
MRAGWGEIGYRRLECRIAELNVVQTVDEMITARAELRSDCQRIGLAPIAVRLRPPHVSHGGAFKGVPVLQLITAAPT